MKTWKPEDIRAAITMALPEGMVIARHTDKAHFYEVRDKKDVGQPVFKEDGFSPNILGPVYESVTKKLHVLKDESLQGYKLNKAMDYIFANFGTLSQDNLMEHLDKAKHITDGVLADAGDIGTVVHNTRQDIFDQWIRTGVRPENFLSFIPKDRPDIRIISCIRALEKFVLENDYIPVRCELLVYSHELKVAGTLDDLGLMRKVIRESTKICDHTNENLLTGEKTTCIVESANGKHSCMACGYQYRYEFVLMDLKTSNQFKDHYFFQVCLYWKKFWKLVGTGWKPERCFILKVSKEDGSYKMEDLKRPAVLARYANAMIKTNEGIDYIKSLRKDNQRKVIEL